MKNFKAITGGSVATGSMPLGTVAVNSISNATGAIASGTCIAPLSMRPSLPLLEYMFTAPAADCPFARYAPLINVSSASAGAVV